MTPILAIDPGTTHSALVWWDGERQESAYLPNEQVEELLLIPHRCRVVCEMIASYGMSVGAEVFETCYWIGRFSLASKIGGMQFNRLYRKDVKMHLCGSVRAKDVNIRQRLIDLYGDAKTGITEGLTKDRWAAFAVAVTFDHLSRLTKP